jgi:hypothetical protein
MSEIRELEFATLGAFAFYFLNQKRRLDVDEICMDVLGQSI